MSKPATATIPLRILIITISHGQALCVIESVLPLKAVMVITFFSFFL